MKSAALFLVFIVIAWLSLCVIVGVTVALAVVVARDAVCRWLAGRGAAKATQPPTKERTMMIDRRFPTGKDLTVLCLKKANDRYVFLFTDAQRGECIKQFGRFAANPELSFNWGDAAALAAKVREVSSCFPAQITSI